MSTPPAMFQQSGPSAPSFDWGGRDIDQSHIGREIGGRIFSSKQQGQTKYMKNPPPGYVAEPLLDKKGQQRQQLHIILETDLRNWQGVSADNIPKDDQGNFKPAHEDDGKRSIYVKGWMEGAVGDAMAAAGHSGYPEEGAMLAVRCTSIGNGPNGPFRQFQAHYKKAPIAAGTGMFGGNAQGQAPEQAYQAPEQQYAPQGYQQTPPAQQAQYPAQQPQQGYAQQPQQQGPPPQQAYQAPPAQQGPPPQQQTTYPPAVQQQAPQGPPPQQPQQDANPWANQGAPTQAPADDPWAGAQQPPY